MKTNLQTLNPRAPRTTLHRTVAGIALLSTAFALSSCKSRFFSFGKEPEQDAAPSNGTNEDLRPGQIALGQNSPSQIKSAPVNGNDLARTPYTAVQGTTKKLALGTTARFDVGGQQVDVTFEKVLDDSRCPKNVVCIWEGEAKLQFLIAVPSLRLSQTVTPTLRAGYPALGQTVVGVVGLELVALSPDTTTANDPHQKVSSPEATVVVGKAP